MTEITKKNRITRRKFFATASVILSSPFITVSPVISSEKQHTVNRGNKINIDHLVADCITANNESDSQAAVREVLQRVTSTPNAVLNALGEPTKAGINVLHSSKRLTIFNATWTPQMNLLPHNHLMWALIGIYTGREDNIIWRRTAESIEAFEAKALFEGDVVSLPADVIHSVTNPLLRFTGGIHVYGGDFFNTTRSQWNPESLSEEPSDGDDIREMFKKENKRMRVRNST